MSDMVINGTIESYFVNETKNGGFQHVVTVNGSKYSAFAKDDKTRANNGDTVEFPVVQKGQYFNISGPIKVLKRAAGHQQGSKQSYAPNEDNRQNSIIRQNAMSQANTMMAALIGSGRYGELSEDEIASEVIRLADDFFFPYAQQGKKPE